MKKYLLVVVLLMLSKPLVADQIRVHCQPHGILFEHINDKDVNEVYNPLPDESIAVIDETEMPPYRYPGQLSCSNGKLLFNPDYKPPYAIEREKRREQIKQANDALDAELGKAEPDVITVLRLQRAIEQLKEDRGKPTGQ